MLSNRLPLKSFLSRVTRTPRFGASRRRLGARLSIQQLEPRALLATFTVDTFADQNDGSAAGGTSLRDAILQANALAGDDTITLPAGTYTLAMVGASEDGGLTGDLDIANNGTLTINGADPTTTIIDASLLSDRVFHVLSGADFSINNSTITGGTIGVGSGGSGGGFYNADAAFLSVTNSTVSNNSADLGAGFRNFGTLSVTNSTVSGNSAALGSGGGFYNDATLSVTSSTVSGNYAYSGGGFENQNGAILSVTSSTISGNDATVGAGFNNYYLAELSVTDSTVSGNSADRGGGFYNYNSPLSVTNSLVSGNSASFGGGAFFNSYGENSELTISNSTVSGNSSSYGGAVYAVAGTLNISNSTISGNSADEKGGGIYSNQGTLMSVEESTVSGNTAVDGGGIHSLYADLTVRDSTVSGNSAIGGLGGGIYHYYESVSVTNSTISGNVATGPGGGLSMNFAQATVTNSTISGNSVEDGTGGGINQTYGALTVFGSTVSGNSASDGGGGLAVFGGVDEFAATVTANNTIVAGNTSTGTAPSDVIGMGLEAASSNNLIGDPATAGGLTHGTNGNILGDGAGGVLDATVVLVDVLVDGVIDENDLANNGGSTLTHALTIVSPAIDAGSNALIPAGVSTDQRGTGFDRIVNGTGDIGAFEFGAGASNQAPVANADTAETEEDTPVLIDVVANDMDDDGNLDPTTVTVTSGPSSGGVTVNPVTGIVTYTPAPDFNGSDAFVYEVCDTDGLCDTAMVTVTVRNLVDVSGRVFNDLDNDGAYEPGDGDAGLSGVTIEVWDQAMTTLFGSTTTAADGTYFVNSNLGAGTYKIVEIVDELVDLGLLDGRETAGNLGGSVDNSQDDNQITAITVGAPGTTNDAIDYLFAEILPSHMLGFVWEDFNDDGEINFGESVIENAEVTLTGTDDRGNAITAAIDQTDTDGSYAFFSLRPGNYTLVETQPAGFVDGRDALGVVNGVPTGDDTVNDTFSAVILPQPGSSAENYNFGERPAEGGGVGSGQTATIGFWHNKNGRALIHSLTTGDHSVDDSATSTQLGDWLASTFPNMYANLTGNTNSEVADFYLDLFKRNKKTAAGGGPPKVDAQVMATVFNVYVTNQTLAGTAASGYGFNVTTTGLGARTFNVGSNGAAFGVDDDEDVQIMDLLLAVNARSANGLLFDMNGDGDTNDNNETLFRTLANDVFANINEDGSL